MPGARHRRPVRVLVTRLAAAASAGGGAEVAYKRVTETPQASIPPRRRLLVSPSDLVQTIMPCRYISFPNTLTD